MAGARPVGAPPGDGAWGWLAAAGLLILALAQPRWGRAAGRGIPDGHDVVFLVDASRSMAAEDAVPDRMGLAIDAASSLMTSLGGKPGDRAAVVAFAGRGVVRCPLTENLEAAGDALRSIRPGEVEPGGTDLGAGLEAAVDAFDEEEHVDGRTIVVFSDGEDHVGSWSSALDRLRAGRIIVHSIAIGDPDRAHPVPAIDPPGRKPRPPDSTRRSDVAFRAIARATGGVLVPIGLVPTDLGPLYRDRIEPIARRRRDGLRPTERIELFPGFVLAAIGLGLVGSWPGLSRRRARRLAFVALALALPSMGAGDEGPDRPSVLVESGRKAYEAGDSRRPSRRSIGLPGGSRPPPSPATMPPPRSTSSGGSTRRRPGTSRPESGPTGPGGQDRLRARQRLPRPRRHPPGDRPLRRLHRFQRPGRRLRRSPEGRRHESGVRGLSDEAEVPGAEGRRGGRQAVGEAPEPQGRGKSGDDRASSSPADGPGEGKEEGDGRRGAGGAGGSGQAPDESKFPELQARPGPQGRQGGRQAPGHDPVPRSPGGVAKDW